MGITERHSAPHQFAQEASLSGIPSTRGDVDFDDVRCVLHPDKPPGNRPDNSPDNTSDNSLDNPPDNPRTTPLATPCLNTIGRVLSGVGGELWVVRELSVCLSGYYQGLVEFVRGLSWVRRLSVRGLSGGCQMSYQRGLPGARGFDHQTSSILPTH